MTKKIFRSIFIVAMLILSASLLLVMGVLYAKFTTIQQEQLKIQVDLAAQGIAHEGADYFKDLAVSNYRITWISMDGTVLYDSYIDSNNMENHLERVEVVEAMTSGYGASERYSSTLMEHLLYVAKRLDNGSVVRLSTSQASILNLLFEMFEPLVLIVMGAVGLSFLLSSRIANRIVKPLNMINLDEPLSNEGYDELTPIFKRIYTQQKQLQQIAEEMYKNKEEFETIISSMNEGLVLLNDKGKILSINPAAMKLFNVTQTCINQDVLEINRSLALQALIKLAQNGERGEQTLEIGERVYQIDISPIFYSKQVSGMVLLIFDISDKAKAMELRREFTANVSHELKTPLHTISGYAELLQNGLVKEHDVPQFISQIYNEAGRMITLVEDIISLSHLDEGAKNLQFERVDLYELVASTIKSLEIQAQKKNIQIALEGTSTPMLGIEHILRGLIFNLCDNAIKYNNQGGKVLVKVYEDNNQIKLMVKDSGIGIPNDQHERIFERFYRVDKSHSKEVGGSGLGLSIVKHAALIHNAQISVESKLGEGTCISVGFPK